MNTKEKIELLEFVGERISCICNQLAEIGHYAQKTGDNYLEFWAHMKAQEINDMIKYCERKE